MNTYYKEFCGACNKYIYSHNKILLYAAENKPYDAKCLKIDNGVASELQMLSDCYCPHSSHSLENIFPFFISLTSATNCGINAENCNTCNKIICASKQK